jgi:ABC-type branched-subunit amino acid transport system substrate-binding protein
VVAAEQTALNRDIATAMTAQLNTAATVTPIALPAGTNSVGQPAQQIADTRPDAIYFTGSGRLAGLLLRRLRHHGTTAPFVMPQSWPCRRRDAGSAEFTAALAGTPATNVSLTCTCLPNPKIPGDFAARYRAAYGENSIGFSVTAYDIAEIFLAGFRAGAGDRAAMLLHLHGYHGRGLAGSYRFTAAGDPDPGTVGRWVTTDGHVEAVPAA